MNTEEINTNNNSLLRIRHIVWDEFVQAKSWEQTISDYSGVKLDRKRRFNIITGMLVIVGSSTWSIWKMWQADWITPVILLIVGISQVLSSMQKYIIPDDEIFRSLAKLRGLYIAYTNKLEKLVIGMLNEELSKEEIEQQYYSLRETIYPIEELKDSLNIIIGKKLQEKVEEGVKDFLEARYGISLSN